MPIDLACDVTFAQKTACHLAPTCCIWKVPALERTASTRFGAQASDVSRGENSAILFGSLMGGIAVIPDF
jgi:hypothetical protein